MDCEGCELKDRCTRGKGRRLKIYQSAPQKSVETEQERGQILIEELNARMEKDGPEMMQWRRQTVEPTNAHLKQHGLSRFHVRGLKRCSAVLTIACLAHNLMKWKVREATANIKLAS